MFKDLCLSVSGFDVGTGDQNAGPLDCTSSILLTTISPASSHWYMMKLLPNMLI